jgi:hypothetical protein
MPESKPTNRNMGMNETTITCSMCDEPFNTEEELRDHQQIVHAAEVNNRRRSRTNDPDEDEQEEIVA